MQTMRSNNQAETVVVFPVLWQRIWWQMFAAILPPKASESLEEAGPNNGTQISNAGSDAPKKNTLLGLLASKKICLLRDGD